MDMMGKPASLFKRFCSVFIDLILVAIMYIVFATCTLQFVNQKMHYNDLLQESNSLVERRQELAIEAGIIVPSEDDSDIFIYAGSYNDSSKEVIEFNESEEIKALQSKYSEVMNKAEKIKFVKFAVDIFLAELPFFLIIPLCRKDGATLGKLLMKLSVVSRNDCRVNKVQTIFRFLVLYLLESVFFYYFFVELALIVLPIVELAVWSFSKHKLFVHDLFCSTKTVENQYSIIFETIQEREEYFIQKEIDDREYALKREENRKKSIDMEGYND